MKQTLLLLDCNYLARRAYHTTGKLQFDGDRTGVLFGFFRDLIVLHEEFSNCRTAFCFDHGGSVRKSVFPGYKSSREKQKASQNKKEVQEEKQFYRQVNNLRDVHLLEIGYNNVFSQPGYEADDLIASVIGSFDGEIIIVSADQDLYQLLSDRVRIWNPQKQFMMTENGFRKKWGLRPRDWIKVKAIAGCSTDDIAGIKGVGEITAAKYLRGELSKGSNAHVAIKAGQEIIHDNKLLVRLPFPGTHIYQLKEDDVSTDKWNAVMKQLGLRSLFDRVPGMIRSMI